MNMSVAFTVFIITKYITMFSENLPLEVFILGRGEDLKLSSVEEVRQQPVCQKRRTIKPGSSGARRAPARRRRSVKQPALLLRPSPTDEMEPMGCGYEMN